MAIMHKLIADGSTLCAAVEVSAAAQWNPSVSMKLVYAGKINGFVHGFIIKLQT